MIDTEVLNVFGLGEEVSLQKLSTGLINHTYKITNNQDEAFLLQQINLNVFPNPLLIQNNYQQIQRYFEEKNSFKLPKIIPTNTGNLLFKKGEVVWRCFEFISRTFSPVKSSNAEEAWNVANCFGKFSSELSNFDTQLISVILPGFHDLDLRFQQFETALKNATQEKINSAKLLIDKAFESKYLVDFYNEVNKTPKDFPLHILHHDCKIANILFKDGSNEIYSPIDLDTTQPGLFFSDIGDMFRSMTPNYSENHKNLEDLEMRKEYYDAIRDGYLNSMGAHLTTQELDKIDEAGKIIVYMQALRFLTDYLNNDVYYQTSYPGQNKDRAANQFQLLFLINDYIKTIAHKKNYTT